MEPKTLSVPEFIDLWRWLHTPSEDEAMSNPTTQASPAVPCHLCWAMVQPELGLKHREWHVSHDLHAADCALHQTNLDQRHTGMYLTPQPCSCGLTP